MPVCDDLEDAGVEFVNETYIGKDNTIDDLFAEGFEAVFVGVGSEVDAPMEVPGEDLPGVYKATEFLMRCNVDLELLPAELALAPDVGKQSGGDWRRRYGFGLPAHRPAPGRR